MQAGDESQQDQALQQRGQRQQADIGKHENRNERGLEGHHQRALGPFPKPRPGGTDEAVYQTDADCVEMLLKAAQPLVLDCRPLVVIPAPNRVKLEVSCES